MAGGPAAETIMFIAAILAAGLVAGSLSTVASELSQGMDARGDALRDELSGRFVIANDPTAVSTTPVVVYVKNTGETTFANSGFVVILDGTAHTDLAFAIGGSSATDTAPGELLEITLTGSDISAETGSHRIVVIADNSHKESLDFTV